MKRKFLTSLAVLILSSCGLICAAESGETTYRNFYGLLFTAALTASVIFGKEYFGDTKK